MGSGALGMPLQIENMDGAFPYGLTLERLFDGHGLDQRGLSAMLAFNDSLELVDTHIHGETLPRFTARSFRTVHHLPARGLLRALDHRCEMRELVLGSAVSIG